MLLDGVRNLAASFMPGMVSFASAAATANRVETPTRTLFASLESPDVRRGSSDKSAGLRERSIDGMDELGRFDEADPDPTQMVSTLTLAPKAEAKVSSSTKKPAALYNIVAPPPGDPLALQVVLFSSDSAWCGGVIGKKGKICIDSDCTIEAHTKKKATLKVGHWYTQRPGELSVSVSPTLDDAIASQSAIWAMYKTGLYRSSAWDSVMSYCKSNAAASSADSILTEAASAGVVLGTFSEANPIPKTPSFRASLREATATSTPTTEVLATALDTGLKRAEESVSDVYAEVVKVSARVGRPSDPSLSHGSAYSDLEALQLYVTEVDSKCKDSAETIQVHEGKFRLVDENFRKCSLTLNQVISTSTQAFTTAADTKKHSHGFECDGLSWRHKQSSPYYHAVGEKGC
jgi:hypothetical protein